MASSSLVTDTTGGQESIAKATWQKEFVYLQSALYLGSMNSQRLNHWYMTSLKKEAVAGPWSHSQKVLELGLEFRSSDH